MLFVQQHETNLTITQNAFLDEELALIQKCDKYLIGISHETTRKVLGWIIVYADLPEEVEKFIEDIPCDNDTVVAEYVKI